MPCWAAESAPVVSPAYVQPGIGCDSHSAVRVALHTEGHPAAAAMCPAGLLGWLCCHSHTSGTCCGSWYPTDVVPVRCTAWFLCGCVAVCVTFSPYRWCSTVCCWPAGYSPCGRKHLEPSTCVTDTLCIDRRFCSQGQSPLAGPTVVGFEPTPSCPRRDRLAVGHGWPLSCQLAVRHRQCLW